MSVLALLGDSDRFFTKAQRHMLDGLLGEEADSSRALHAWVAAVNIDDIDPASYRLIPALYARSGAHPALQQIHGRMKGIYRYYFYRNNKFLARIEIVFQALMAAGIDFIIFKGISILLQYHNSAAGRSSADCDILVHPRDKLRAEAVLADCGLAYVYDADRKMIDLHSHDFADAAGTGFDLHWYALLECCAPGVDNGFWERSRYITWKGKQLRVLAPEDELLIAGINGVRGMENARADWLYDASLILRARPDFDWRLLLAELNRRRLQQPFMAALGLLRRFVSPFPRAFVEKEFRNEIRMAAGQLVAENRSFALDAGMGRELTAAIAPSSWFQRVKGAIMGTDWRGLAARSGGVVRHLRYDMDQDSSVSQIFLHRDVLPFLDEIFDVADPVLLQKTVNISQRGDEVAFNLPPGLLRVPPQTRSREYAATITADSQLLSFSSPDIASLPVEVTVTNDSTWPWHVFAGSDRGFALSHHLFAENGTCLRWDLPRVNLVIARQGYVAVLLPGDNLKLTLDVFRPPAPGRYQARLDIVHEHVAWFDPQSEHFPILAVEVS